MKKTILLWPCLLLLVMVQAQSGLSFAAGTSLTVQPNTIFSVDGLVLEPSAHFTISGENSLQRNSNTARPTINTYINRVFKWNAITTGFSGSITIYYDDSELNGIRENELTLNIHDGRFWLPYNTGITRDGLNNYVTTSGLSDLPLHELTLAGWFAPLPLQWSKIKAYRDNSKAWIEWESHYEEGVLKFQVESSLDGLHWNQVGGPVNALHSPGANHYKVADMSITPAHTSYRIKQTETDGSFSYTRIVTVPALQIAASLMVYPNPARETIVIESRSSADVESFVICNALGKIVKMERGKKKGKVIVNMQRFPSGVYYILLKLSDGTEAAGSFLKN